MMRFAMKYYYTAFKAECIEKGIWHGTRSRQNSWEECFNGLGFSSYKFCGYHGDKWHYLSEAEFVIFALRYSS